MVEYLAQDEGMVTHQLIFKDIGISERTYMNLEKRVKKYKENTVLTHVPVANEVIIIINKKCKNDECRKEETEKFIKFYNMILSKMTIK